jgi:hypothetical protein
MPQDRSEDAGFDPARRVNEPGWRPAWTRACRIDEAVTDGHPVSAFVPLPQHALRIKTFRLQQASTGKVTPCFAGQSRYET